jgi:hypothetical protein
VIGIGSYDTAKLALDFRERHDLQSVRAFYDGDAKSRRVWKILGQPSGLLIGVDGKILARYTGEIDYDDVLTKV